MAKRLSVVAVVCLLLGGTATWYWWPRTPPPDPQVQEARALQTKLAASFTQTTDVKETIQSMGKLRESMEKMTPEQRREVMEGPGGPREMMRRDAEEFVSLPLDKRNAFLDKRIDQMEKFMAAMRQSGNGGPPRGERPQGNPGGGGRTRLERSRDMLNRTNPEERALFSEYFSALMERRKERGLPGFGPR
jgi:hypothetical protein